MHHYEVVEVRLGDTEAFWEVSLPNRVTDERVVVLVPVRGALNSRDQELDHRAATLLGEAIARTLRAFEVDPEWGPDPTRLAYRLTIAGPDAAADTSADLFMWLAQQTTGTISVERAPDVGVASGSSPIVASIAVGAAANVAAELARAIGTWINSRRRAQLRLTITDPGGRSYVVDSESPEAGLAIVESLERPGR